MWYHKNIYATLGGDGLLFITGLGILGEIPLCFMLE